MWELSVNMSGMLCWIGVGVLVLAFRHANGDVDSVHTTKLPGVRLMDWTSGWLLMLSYSVIGVSATAIWSRFSDVSRFAFFVVALTALIFAQTALVWFLVKRSSDRRASGQAGS